MRDNHYLQCTSTIQVCISKFCCRRILNDKEVADVTKNFGLTDKQDNLWMTDSVYVIIIDTRSYIMVIILNSIAMHNRTYTQSKRSDKYMYISNFLVS